MITTDESMLRMISRKFKGTDKELQNIVKCLQYEFDQSETKGNGLSAIQINIPFRVCIIRLGDRRPNYELWNAEIIKKEQPYTFKGEGCLSVPGQFKNTSRYNLITVRNGNGKELKFSGYEALVVQHEIDHWNGVLFIDREVKEVAHV